MVSVYLIAGEASGDTLGSLLMQSLKRQADMRFDGIGGEKMAAEGLESLFDYQDLSLFGFAEVLPHALKILARVEQAVEDIILKQPDVVITIDVPGYSLRVAEKLRKRGYAAGKLVHYVAPTVWAYKPERAKLCAKLFDLMLAVLPFEPPYFEAEGLACQFVGHPAILQPKGDGAAFREKHQMGEAPLLCLFPGSRRGELKRHLPIFTKTVAMLGQRHPGLVLAVAVPKQLMPQVVPAFAGAPYRILLLSGEAEKRDAVAAAQAALSKSGTIVLETALAGLPQVVTYRVNWLTARLLKRILKTKYVSLVNILLQREAIPEYLQERAKPELLSGALDRLLTSPELATAQREAAHEARRLLAAPGGRNPSHAAAEAVLQLLSEAVTKLQ